MHNFSKNSTATPFKITKEDYDSLYILEHSSDFNVDVKTFETLQKFKSRGDYFRKEVTRKIFEAFADEIISQIEKNNVSNMNTLQWLYAKSSSTTQSIFDAMKNSANDAANVAIRTAQHRFFGAAIFRGAFSLLGFGISAIPGATVNPNTISILGDQGAKVGADLLTAYLMGKIEAEMQEASIERKGQENLRAFLQCFIDKIGFEDFIHGFSTCIWLVSAKLFYRFSTSIYFMTDRGIEKLSSYFVDLLLHDIKKEKKLINKFSEYKNGYEWSEAMFNRAIPNDQHELLRGSSIRFSMFWPSELPDFFEKDQEAILVFKEWSSRKLKRIEKQNNVQLIDIHHFFFDFANFDFLSDIQAVFKEHKHFSTGTGYFSFKGMANHSASFCIETGKAYKPRDKRNDSSKKYPPKFIRGNSSVPDNSYLCGEVIVELPEKNILLTMLSTLSISEKNQSGFLNACTEFQATSNAPFDLCEIMLSVYTAVFKEFFYSYVAYQQIPSMILNSEANRPNTSSSSEKKETYTDINSPELQLSTLNITEVKKQYEEYDLEDNRLTVIHPTGYPITDCPLSSFSYHRVEKHEKNARASQAQCSSVREEEMACSV